MRGEAHGWLSCHGKARSAAVAIPAAQRWPWPAEAPLSAWREAQQAVCRKGRRRLLDLLLAGQPAKAGSEKRHQQADESGGLFGVVDLGEQASDIVDFHA